MAATTPADADTTESNGPLDDQDADLPWTRVAAYATCLDGEHRILLARLAPGFPGAGRWTLPGGGLDWGESPEDGVRREVEEETGLRGGTLGGVLGVYSRAHRRGPTRPSHSVHVIGVVYRLGGLEGTLRDEVGGSTDACAWFTLEQARALTVVPLVDYALDRLDGAR